MPHYLANPAGRVRGTAASPVTGEIDVRPFREAFEQSGLSLSEIARRCGWTRVDQPRAGRALGFHRDHGEYRQRLRYETAVALMEALDLDPIDVGL
jgi:hypothetical protein